MLSLMQVALNLVKFLMLANIILTQDRIFLQSKPVNKQKKKKREGNRIWYIDYVM